MLDPLDAVGRALDEASDDADVRALARGAINATLDTFRNGPIASAGLECSPNDQSVSTIQE